jgi:protein CpxP
MKPIGKQTVLVTLVIVLVALNIGLVTFMWYTQRPDRGPGGPETASFLMHELKFSKEQEQHYLELQRELTDSIEPIRERERQIHDRFFDMMHATTPDSALVASTIDSMGHIRAQLEYFTFIHFRQVRALCNTEQQQRFDRIITETMRRMGPRPSGPRHDPHRPSGPPDGVPAH